MIPITHTSIKKQLQNNIFGLELLTDLHDRNEKHDFSLKIERIKRNIQLCEHLISVIPINKNDKLIDLREEFRDLSVEIDNIKSLHQVGSSFFYSLERRSQLNTLNGLRKRQEELMLKIKELEC